MSALVVAIDEAGSCPTKGGSHVVRAARGFTLIDVLVTMAVVGVLIAIMIPSLTAVRETAHQVVCRSNVRQIGYGIEMFADANKSVIPQTLTVPSQTDLGEDQSFETMTLRYPADWQTETLAGRWDGLGLLFPEHLLAPKIFYCPSHRGTHAYREYVDAWLAEEGLIVGNFQYRGRGPTGGSVGGVPRMSVRLDHITPGAALVADGMRTQSDFSHQIGTNVLRADISVDWFNDTGRTLVESLAKDGQPPSASVIQTVWQQLDLGVVR